MAEAPMTEADVLAALASGDGDAVLARLTEGAGRNDPMANQVLAGLAYADDRFDQARTHLEIAFREFRAAGELRRAARVASLLGELHWGCLGNEAAGRGWLERGRRLLEKVGPCVEWGYWELARLACDRADVDDLARSAGRALELALEHGDVGLEVRALADGGLALVSQGRVREGFDRLDEALAALTSGEVRDPFVMGTAFCALLSSCDRAGNLPRAEEWLRLVEDVALRPAGGRPRVLATHCHVALGGVLWSAGRWQEAEEAILAALGPNASRTANHRTQALSRLADLRVQQGRVDEAAELVAGIADDVVAAGPAARVHLLRGEPNEAAALLQRAVRRSVGDVLRSAPLLALLVVAELEMGDVRAANEAADLLASMARAVDAPLVAGLSMLSTGRVARAEGRPDVAIAEAEEAVRLLAGEQPLLLADARLELAEALAAAGDDSSAAAEARLAHSAAEVIGAQPLRDRSAALLRRLGSAAPRPSPGRDALGTLTAREADVLEGIRRGETNASIAARLYLSPKTVEHHVGRVLSKLGVRSRAEAAAVAAAAAARGSGG